MADPEFIQWIATLGVGGVLAGFIFLFYRKDVKQYTELWRMATDQFMIIVKENTASNSKLISLIESQERNMMRKSDIIEMLEQARQNMDRSERLQDRVERREDEKNGRR